MQRETPDLGGRSPALLVAGCAAATLAVLSAAVTAFWLGGGTALLDTLGGAVERLARGRSVAALVAVAVVAVAKLCAAALAIALVIGMSRRWATLAVVGGVLLALYGAVLTRRARSS